MPFLPVVALARREWLLLLKDPKPRLLLLVVTLLVPLSVYASVRELRELAKRTQDVQRSVEIESRKEAVTGGDIEPALRVIRQPTIGTTFATGSHAHLPLYWDIGAAGLRYGPPAGSYSAGPSGPRIDLEYLIRVVVGLFALLLGLDSIGGERQNDTLRPLLSQPVSTAAIILGKCAANGALLGSVMLWTVTLGYATIAMSAPPAKVPFGMIAGFAILSWTYLMFCFGLGLACSSVGASIPGAQIVAISLWLLQSAVSAPLIASAIETLTPLRTRADFEAELQRVYSRTSREMSITLGSELLARTGRSDWWKFEDEPNEHARINRELDPLWSEFAQRWAEHMIDREAQWNRSRQRQDEAVAWASTLSAGLLFNRLAGDLVGTGGRSANLWHQAVVRHQSRVLEPLVAKRPRLLLRVPEGETRQIYTLVRDKPLLVTEVPPFEPPTRPVSEVGRADVVRLVGQVCVVAVLASFGIARLRKTAFEK